MATVHMDMSGAIAVIRIDNLKARNAMTLDMYAQLEAILSALDLERVKGVVVTGHSTAFASGTDIAAFQDFGSTDEAMNYENDLERILRRVEQCPVPTLAAISGACTGGGAVLAAACDLRIASPSMRFGVPIARTLGNCLSIANLRRLVALIGLGRVQDMMLRARLLDAEAALASGLISEIVPEEQLLTRAAQILAEILGFAPLTIDATRGALRNLSDEATASEGYIRQCYGSQDFREGVTAFLGKRAPQWVGA